MIAARLRYKSVVVSAGRWELTGVPYTSAREPGGIAGAIGVLRGLGLAERLAGLGVEDAGDLDLPPPSGERGRSGLLNESAIVALVAATRARVAEAHRRGRLPLLVGGDCPVLLGALAAIRDGAEQPALAMLDGHEDAWPPASSPTGEASDSEVAIALGRVLRLPKELDRLAPLLDPERLALVGPRDRAEIAAAGVASLGLEVGSFADAVATAADPAAIEDRVARTVAAAGPARGFWLHIDLDVLSSSAFAAVDYPQPGGIGWEVLDRLARGLAGDDRCRGASIVIYNPDLDPGRADARKLIEFASRLAS